MHLSDEPYYYSYSDEENLITTLSIAGLEIGYTQQKMVMRYKLSTANCFGGYFEIEADNRNFPKRLVGENFGLVMGGNIHTNLMMKKWIGILIHIQICI